MRTRYVMPGNMGGGGFEVLSLFEQPAAATVTMNGAANRVRDREADTAGTTS
ncbi:MAG: hypothetical protein H0T46_10780 [Deltaproteobacteria bacterium]|nr:hypothetical protein [Deltaproteobacteria bacterium]